MPVERAVEEHLAEKRAKLSPRAMYNRVLWLRWIPEKFPGRLIGDIQPAEWRHAIVCSRGKKAKSSWKDWRCSFLEFAGWCATGNYLSPATLLALHDIWKWEPIKDKDRRREKLDYSREEIDLLCSGCPPEKALYVRCACWLGFRKSELIGEKGLFWRDIDAEWVVFIPGARRKNGTDFQYPIPTKLRPYLGERAGPDEPLIPGVYGGTLWRDLQRIARRTNFTKHVSPHHFRRTWCRWFKEAGGTREEARDVQGWADTNIILNHYWPRVDVSAKRRLIERM